MSWSAEQRRLLSGMGYTLYRQLPAAAASPPASDVSMPAADSPLWRALLRAAGPRGLDGVALPPMERLRASGREKKALWPRLRSLRRP